jgi:hypothetical protein
MLQPHYLSQSRPSSPPETSLRAATEESPRCKASSERSHFANPYRANEVFSAAIVKDRNSKNVERLSGYVCLEVARHAYGFLWLSPPLRTLPAIIERILITVRWEMKRGGPTRESTLQLVLANGTPKGSQSEEDVSRSHC